MATGPESFEAQTTVVVYRVQSRRTREAAAGQPWRWEWDADTPEDAKREVEEVARDWGEEKQTRVLKVTTTTTTEEVEV